MNMEINVKNSGIVQLSAHRDARRGDLFVAEATKNIPFPIRRVYFISNIPDTAIDRGGHAHKKTEQVIFCAQGSFTINLDDGSQKQKILLDRPEIGIILGAKLWHSADTFSKNCVMLHLASELYDEHDYIRNYDDFLEFIKKTQ